MKVCPPPGTIPWINESSVYGTKEVCCHVANGTTSSQKINYKLQGSNQKQTSMFFASISYAANRSYANSTGMGIVAFELTLFLLSMLAFLLTPARCNMRKKLVSSMLETCNKEEL